MHGLLHFSKCSIDFAGFQDGSLLSDSSVLSYVLLCY